MIASRPIRSATVVAVTICATLLPSRVAAQIAPAREQARFVDDARRGTRRYLTRQNAIDDGFTRVGVEFPAMGEHWVSFARVMEDAFDAKRPTILIYMNTSDGAQLAGVAYSKLVRRRDQPPDFPFAGAWHEHSATVTEGSLPLSHATHPRPAVRAGRAAVDDPPAFFVLHAWIWSTNPDGQFATDNWTLPLQRRGLPIAKQPERSVVRAIALAEDEDEYYRLVIRSMLALSDREDVAVARVIDTHRARAKQELATIRDGQRLSPRSSARLGAVWASLWTALERALPERKAELRALQRQV
ncbi:MAG: hypothetical protein ABI910_22005 [Gemmatimonadota bacterium]